MLAVSIERRFVQLPHSNNHCLLASVERCNCTAKGEKVANH